MSVRDALLGILSLGPAYGLQLHGELASRAPHRAATNVGQVYATLDRLCTAGLVRSATRSSDGLPRYELTPAGLTVASAWMRGDDLRVSLDWPELLDRVLISRSVSADHAHTLLERARAGFLDAAWLATPGKPASLSELATHRFAEAALAWLDDASAHLATAPHGYTEVRPRRGRPRKSTTAASPLSAGAPRQN
jgi:DNA-binding PadR family transcriptional regulator